MKKSKLSTLSLLLALAMCSSLFVACGGGIETTETKGQESVEQTSESTSDGSQTEIDESTDTKETETEITGPQLEGENALLIETAESLKNAIQAGFTTADRKSFRFENQEMFLEYALTQDQVQNVTALKNKNGKSYLENTMDVFVTMKDGKTYYASNSLTDATANIYRLGYYFYEMRFEEQGFHVSSAEMNTQTIKHTKYEKTKDIGQIKGKNGELLVTNAENAMDPYIVFASNLSYSADQYTILEITMMTDSKASSNGEVYLIAGDQTGFSDMQTTYFPLQNDSQYHTYRIMLGETDGYRGTLKGLRLDISGPGASYQIKEIKLIAPGADGSPADLGLNRSFMTYSDKMHQVIQVAARRDTTDIAEIGMLTELKEESVAKLIVKDQNGTHETLDGVDWHSAEYVGFDIRDAGIFGYILPFDDKGGQLKVTLKDGVYTIVQSAIPENNRILASLEKTNNANDFFMGQRIYTDANHSFDAFLKEAFCERNPLTAANITVNAEYSSNAKFEGYDSLRGIYSFTVDGPSGGFNGPYYNSPNRHYRTDFNINGDEYDRNIYVLVHNDIFTLECAVLLDKNDVLLPIPIEVGKNFSEAVGERNLYNIDDPTYGEAIFPMVVAAGSEDNNYTLLNLYQLWGKYPLKQLSWIQFYAPYYHLSTGVTESNCILPWFTTKGVKSLNTLPDFRSMSAPLWTDQPQRNSCGTHQWLKYTDANGNYVTSESIRNTIGSHGPTYADVTMEHLSDDGKIKVTYTHIEMPQTDENRTYYEINYEILEDISFQDFSRDFQFYSVFPNDETGAYTKIGYLNEQNQPCIVDVDPADPGTEYVLGDQCPYFSFFDMKNYSRETGYANVAFLIYNYDFTIGGKEADPHFAIVAQGKNETVALTLALDETVLKAGDSFKINAILLPWGSQKSDYSGNVPDKNVRDVRENTLLNPLKATAVADCTVIESTYLPKLCSTNGKSAEFTLSGGENNIAVRIYGFNKMTVPVIYEKVDGKWVEYEISSQSTPDANGSAHSYDGYNIYYDGDGTFSYSFVVTMKNGAPRTFKLVADGNYDQWEKEKYTPVDKTESLIDPSSGYTESTLSFGGHIDFINGKKISRQIRPDENTSAYSFNESTVNVPNIGISGNSILAIRGWMIVDGGISKYVWSADNGKTWNDISTEYYQAGNAILEAASARNPDGHIFNIESAANGGFQGIGLIIDLSDYAETTVDIIIAAVPKQNIETLRPIIRISDIQVLK